MPDLHLQFHHDDGPVSPAPPSFVDEASSLRMLCSATFVAEQLVPWGSNYTFAVGLTDQDNNDCLAIYKPQAGERPLWDFPEGTLYRREVASYLLSRWLGWHLVPPTVIRDGPHGVGSLQLYVAPDPAHEDDHAFWSRRILPIERMVMFDHLANNADRKIGHCLVDVAGRIWGIDHGLTFNADPKLRTVLWQFNGEAIHPSILADLQRMAIDGEALLDELRGVLAEEEVDAFRRRLQRVVDLGRYPRLDPHRNIPYGWW